MTARFRFRLDTVLRVRRVEEARALEALAASTREVARRAATMRRARAACDALPSVLEPMVSNEFAAFRQRARRLAEHAALATEAHRFALAAHEEARQQMIRANQSVSALERLHDRRRGEWIDDTVRAEAAELDDVTSSRSAAASLHEHATPAGDGR